MRLTSSKVTTARTAGLTRTTVRRFEAVGAEHDGDNRLLLSEYTVFRSKSLYDPLLKPVSALTVNHRNLNPATLAQIPDRAVDR